MARQSQIPGTENERVAELEEASEQLYKVRQQRVKLSMKESELVEKVQNLAKEHGVRKQYRRGELIVELLPPSGKGRVRVRHVSDEAEEADEE